RSLFVASAQAALFPQAAACILCPKGDSSCPVVKEHSFREKVVPHRAEVCFWNSLRPSHSAPTWTPSISNLSKRTADLLRPGKQKSPWHFPGCLPLSIPRWYT